MDRAEMKYIMVRNTYGCLCPIIFDKLFDHSGIAQVMPCGYEIVSAGMVDVFDDDGQIKVGCWGKSTTLGLKSENGDAEIIQKQLVYTP